MKNKKQIIKFGILTGFIIIAIFLIKYFGVSQLLDPAMLKEKIRLNGQNGRMKFTFRPLFS